MGQTSGTATAAATLGEFLERVLPIEVAMREMFRRLGEKLGRFPALAALLLRLEEEEREHFQLISGFRDSLTPELLARPCEEETVRQLVRVAALLESDPVAHFLDFEEAYEFIHELENGEVAPLIRLLHGECRRGNIDCSALRAIVEPHLADVEGLADAAGDRAQRRAMRL